MKIRKSELKEPKTLTRLADWRIAAAAFEDFCERRLGLMLAAGTALYFAAMMVESALKPLWYDEMFTHYLAMLPVPRLWAALCAGAEVHPPLSILAAHFAQALLGPTALATRLPEIVAFWLMSVAVFFLVRGTLGMSWGLAAVLLIFISDAEYYATEARPYSIVLCCAAVALLSWQNLHGSRRRFFLICLLLSMAAAVSAHFMAVLIAIPIAAGEVFRIRRRRQVDFSFWLVTIAGLSVILCYLPIMHAAQHYLAHNSQGAGHTASIAVLFGLLLLPLLPVLATALIGLWITCGLPSWSSSVNAATRGNGIHSQDIAAALAFFLLPLCQVALEHWTRSVNPRYTLSYVLGASLLFTYGCALMFSRTRAAGFVCLLFFASALATGALLHYRAVHKLPLWPPRIDVAELPDLPILVDQGFHYTPLYWYNPDLQSRMYFVASPEDALRVSHSDTAELNLLFEKDWAPIKVAERKQFYYPGSKFLYYQSFVDGIMFPDWQIETMKDLKASVSLVKRLTPTDVIYQVEIPVRSIISQAAVAPDNP
jgi:hypothetical protein